MKKVAFIVLIFTVLSFAKYDTPNIIGKWKVKTKKKSVF